MSINTNDSTIPNRLARALVVLTCIPVLPDSKLCSHTNYSN